MRQMLSAVEQATDTTFTPQEATSLAHGADEIDLVYSGLEETMVEAYHEIREIYKQHRGIDMRTASMVSAIDKIATSYRHRGIFP
jgi:glutamate dehydrogenase (NAD(P)+)